MKVVGTFLERASSGNRTGNLQSERQPRYRRAITSVSLRLLESASLPTQISVKQLSDCSEIFLPGFFLGKLPGKNDRWLEMETLHDLQDVARGTGNRKQTKLFILQPLVAEIQRFSQGEKKSGF